MGVPFALVKDNKILMVAEYYEDLEEFVEELKQLNPKWIDRRQFRVVSGSEIIKEWNRKQRKKDENIQTLYKKV